MMEAMNNCSTIVVEHVSSVNGFYFFASLLLVLPSSAPLHPLPPFTLISWYQHIFTQHVSWQAVNSSHVHDCHITFKVNN
jgi:hypothetical protein